MADSADIGLPTINQFSAALTESPDDIIKQATTALTEAASDLVAGRSPMQSKTLWFNAAQAAAGIVGLVGSAYLGGNPEVLYPSLALVVNGVANSFLRGLTNGPIVTQGMDGIMNALATLPSFVFKKG
jgi:hypothetical protein